MKQIPIAVIMPSRGMPMARTIEWVEEQRKNYPITLFMSHDLPIPECYNKLINTALKGNFVYFLFLEDDIVPSRKALDNLVYGMGYGQLVCIDYPFRGGYSNISRDTKGSIMSCGTGCLLVSRPVFELVPKPYFRSDWKYDWQTAKWSKVNPKKVYGLQDMWFTFQARKQGFTIHQAPGECIHLGLTKLNKSKTNVGCHFIGERPKISQQLIRVNTY